MQVETIKNGLTIWKESLIFFSAFTIRILMLSIVLIFNLPTKLTMNEIKEYSTMNNPPLKVQLGDASDCYYTAEKMEVPPLIGGGYGYSHWYERNPLHTLVLYLSGRNILFQILLSSLTVLLLYRLNPVVGWIYMFYPQSIIYSVMFTKVTLMTFLFVLAVYAFRFKEEDGRAEILCKSVCVVISALIVQLFFSSIFNFFPTPGVATEFHRSVISKVVGLWQPSFDHTPIVVGNWIQFIQAPFYLLMMFLFVRKVKFNYAWVIVIIFTIGAAFQYAHPFHREFLLPVILLSVIEEMSFVQPPLSDA